MANEKPQGFVLMEYSAHTQRDPNEVLNRVVSVLRTIDEGGVTNWPSLAEWKARLPAWFVMACAEPMSIEQTAEHVRQMRSLTSDERTKVERALRWALDDWLYWMEPNNRYWFWWNGFVIDDHHIEVTVEADELPFPWESLQWLFRAAGADDLTEKKE